MSAGPQPEGTREGGGASRWLLPVLAGGLVGIGVYWFPAPPDSAVEDASAAQGGPERPDSPPEAPRAATRKSLPEAAQRILAAEALTQELVGQLRVLSAHYGGEHGGAVPRGPSSVFAPEATANTSVRPETLDGPLAPGAIRVLDWTLTEVSTSPDAALRVGLTGLVRMERAHFEIEAGSFREASRRDAESLFRVELIGRSASGILRAVTGQVAAQWRRANQGEAPWRLTAWSTTALRTVEVEDWLYRDVLAEVVDDETRRALEHSEHADKLLAVLKGGPDQLPRHPFEFASMDRHPGLAVVDIDRDGWDDMYVMPRWGKNQLLLNQGGERFVEAAAQWGLDLEDTSSSAIFADYDNDGDQDVIIGRTLSESVLLIQDAGRFRVAEPEATGGPLPRLVSSVSVVDYDRDGLLDVYFSTYATTMVSEARDWLRRERRLGDSALAGYVPDEAAARLGKLLADEAYSAFLDRPGPPNRLYRNVGGGRFEPVESALGVFRNTFQSTWSDYDGDGDADVYVSNDYSANHLFRNDSGTFVDVTEATGTADLGFGMGASWGDYDNDGRFDLYTSNMYSRAGRRIMGAIADIDPRLKRAARGNTLFHNEGPTFRRTSSLGPEGLEVERAGWSWGGQFGDLDNDGREDLHVLSGHYSAPAEVAIDRDT